MRRVVGSTVLAVICAAAVGDAQQAKPTLDSLAWANGTRVVFENPTHDFPQQIIDWRDGADLRARIEGTMHGESRLTLI